MENEIYADFVVRDTLDREGVNPKSIRGLKIMLAPFMGTRGVLDEILARHCLYRTVDPTHDGYCYLTWFDRKHWSALAEALGNYPTIMCVMKWAEEAGVELSGDLFVARFGNTLHAVGSDYSGAVSYRELELDVRAKLAACAVGGSGRKPEIVVTIDVPDPDNFLMAYQAIKDNADSRVSVVLHPRPVDLRCMVPENTVSDIIRLHPDFKPGDVVASLLTGGKSGASDLIRRLYETDRQQYLQFRDFSDREVLADSKRYMALSANRLQVFLQDMGVWGDDIDIYVDYGAMVSSVPVPISHAMHKEDYFFGYSGVVQYNASMTELSHHKKSFREKQDALRALRLEHIHKYERQLAEHGLENFRDYSVLLERLRGLRVDLVYVGGPFTQLSALLKQPRVSVDRVVAMACFLREGSSLFKNQFNIDLDMAAAVDVFSRVDDGEFLLLLTPTELAKASVFEIAADQVAKLAKPARDLLQAWFGSEKGGPVFDWVCALAVSGHLPVHTVNMDWRCESGIFRLIPENPVGGILVYVGQEHVSEREARKCYDTVIGSM